MKIKKWLLGHIVRKIKLYLQVSVKKQSVKTYTLDKITDKHIGKRSTPKRDAFESELLLDLLSKEFKRKHPDAKIGRA